jgi:putative sporulation protein YtaF
MHWISIILIAFASNLDNLGIGITFGIRSTTIPNKSNGIIAAITMLGTYISITMGEFVSRYLHESVANIGGAAIIIAIGIWTVAGSLRNKELELTESRTSSNMVDVILNPSTADTDGNKVISLKESLTLGLALALNNMATGFGAGSTGVSPLWTTVMAGLFSLLFIGVGSRVGSVISRTWFGRYSVVIAGILLISIGLYEMIA